MWLFFGDKALPAEERPPLPTVPALSAPGWHVVQGELAFEANHAAVFDNALSLGALQAALGGRDTPGGGAGEVEVERDTWGVTTRFRWVTEGALQEGEGQGCVLCSLLGGRWQPSRVSDMLQPERSAQAAHGGRRAGGTSQPSSAQSDSTEHPAFAAPPILH